MGLTVIPAIFSNPKTVNPKSWFPRYMKLQERIFLGFGRGYLIYIVRSRGRTGMCRVLSGPRDYMRVYRHNKEKVGMCRI